MVKNYGIHKCVTMPVTWLSNFGWFLSHLFIYLFLLGMGLLLQGGCYLFLVSKDFFLIEASLLTKLGQYNAPNYLAMKYIESISF